MHGSACASACEAAWGVLLPLGRPFLALLQLLSTVDTAESGHLGLARCMQCHWAHPGIGTESTLSMQPPARVDRGSKQVHACSRGYTQCPGDLCLEAHSCCTLDFPDLRDRIHLVFIRGLQQPCWQPGRPLAAELDCGHNAAHGALAAHQHSRVCCLSWPGPYTCRHTAPRAPCRRPVRVMALFGGGKEVSRCAALPQAGSAARSS